MTRTNRIDPESFRGKLYLLIVDKIVLGAVIAAAFVAYDQWKAQEARLYEETVQRAEYLKELVPIVVDSDNDNDVLVRAQALVALIDRRAVDPRTAFVLTERLLRSGLMFSDLPHDEGGVYLRSHEDHFLAEALLSFMPSALPTLLDHYLVSSFPGSMDYEQRLAHGDIEGGAWRYRKDAPLFWERLIAEVIDRSPDSELAVLDDDSFLAQGYLSVLARAVHPSVRRADREPKGLRILHSLQVLGRPGESPVLDRLEAEEERYLLSLVSCPLGEDRGHVISDVVRLLEQNPNGSAAAPVVAQRLAEKVGECRAPAR